MAPLIELSRMYKGPTQQDRVQINSTTLDYSGLGLSQQTDSTGTTYFTRCSCGLLNNERLPNGNRYYYLFDGLGSVVGLTDGSGNKVNSYDYDPYGVMLKQTEGVSNPFKYAAGYLDASGYYQFGDRYYDPTLGRWTQQDPVGGSLFDLNSGNRYTYVDDNPVNKVDPSGKDWLDSFLGCMSQKVQATVAIVDGVIGAIGTLGAGVATLLGATTTPLWLTWMGIIGSAIALGVVIFCAGYATGV